MWVFNDMGLVGTLVALAVTFRHTAVISRGGNRAAEGMGTAALWEKTQTF